MGWTDPRGRETEGVFERYKSEYEDEPEHRRRYRARDGARWRWFVPENECVS